MKLAVLGATGQSGQEFVTQALVKGHDLVALVRNPLRMKTKHDRLKTVEANIFNAKDLAKYFEGCDVVVSCLGSGGSLPMLYKTGTFYTQSARAIVAAMRQTNIRRFIFMSSWGVEGSDGCPRNLLVFVKYVYNRVLTEMLRMEKYLEEKCPGIDYTSVRPPSLRNNPGTDVEVKMEVGVNYSANMRFHLPFADVARAMLEIMEGNLFVRQCVAVGHPK